MGKKYMLKDKIKAMLAASDKTASQAAEALGISTHGFYNKQRRNSFTVQDLITLADLCGASIQIKGNDWTMTLDSKEDSKY